ncbi:MAG: abhydrolase domain-containing 18 [Chloroflexi bacterium]|nr:MAG: abhydrolase domain-containing 18 [Chloroflexota bacterium]
MNRAFAHFVDNAIEYTLGRYKHWYTPNQFQPIPDGAIDWSKNPPESFFAIPDDLPDLTFEQPYVFHHDRVRSLFTFPSPYTSPHPTNNIVHGLADLRANRKSRGALILVHGYMMSSFAPLRLFAELVAKHGVDIYYLSLPYHMQRAPLGTWSGQYSLSSDVVRSIESFRQGVMDVRALINWIQREARQPVFLAGMSLGAFTCSMASVVDARPAGLISLLGGADLSDIVFAGNSFYLIRQSLLKHGIQHADLEQYWAGISPGNFRSRLPRENIVMVAGEHDPIITPQNAARLWRAWDEPDITWLPCGHASLSLYARRVGDVVFDFVDRRLDELYQADTGKAGLTVPVQTNM